MIGLVDEHNAAHVPTLTVKRDGRSVEVTVSTTLPTGDGRIVYAPEGKPLATWDYTLETD